MKAILLFVLGLASAQSWAAEIVLRFDEVMGPVKPVNGVGQPPMNGAPTKFAMMHYLKEAGVPYARLHDVGGPYGQLRYVDIPNVFRDFDADENDPESYSFAYTDALMKALDENGVEPFYRLGVTIDNPVNDGFPGYFIDPPKDFAKWARICEHVIRHYTEGWANGFRMKATYWEIWNEPDNEQDPKVNPLWRAPFSDYIRFYGTVAPYLKSLFPHLKIGGYGSCGFYAGVGAGHVKEAHSSPRMEYFIECATNFLSAVRTNGWPLDFFSFHSYSKPAEALRQVRYADELLTSYGFQSDRTERIFNEWLPYVSHGNLGTALQAAGIAAELIGLQNGPCGLACIYDAKCGIGDYSALFNPMTYRPHKAYYAFTAFNELRKRGRAIRTEVIGAEVLHVAAAVGTDGTAAVMLANDGDAPVAVRCEPSGWELVDVKLTDQERTEAYQEDLETMPPHSFAVVTLRRSGTLAAEEWGESQWLSAKDAPVFTGAAGDGARAAEGTHIQKGTNPRFEVARPVWPQGRETRMNDFVEFRASFDMTNDKGALLRITGSSVYRISLNGQFAGYGPARAAKGYFRVDEWPLAVRQGRNELKVEVSAYNCNNYYIPEWTAFLQAEVVSDDNVLAATGRDFSAFDTPRVTKASRYSYQRGFGEAYRLSPTWEGGELSLADRPAIPLLDRIASYPDFSICNLSGPISATCVSFTNAVGRLRLRYVDKPEPTFKLYRADDLDVNICRELRRVAIEPRRLDFSGEDQFQIQEGQGLVFDAGREETGFPCIDVVCARQGRLWMAFDEILTDGKVDPLRGTVANGVVWELEPGTYRLEAFEPYAFRYLHVYAQSGDMIIARPRVRRYRNPDAGRASFRASDPMLGKIFDAARESFAQNAVDVFTDCPGRERAGWLCDSFFTGRASLMFTGRTDLERLFLQNYLLPKKFEDLPDGMLPMCYPSDHPNGNFIPNWAMWFVIELDEYLARSGDRATVDALKPRLVKMVEYLKTFRNSDGLLERLPGWVFVEWSEANRLVKDVNYPSNMTWAETLDCMDRLYGMPDLAEEARRVRETIRRQSWTGRWFCDNSVRGEDGKLVRSGKCTETCQYYAFFFHVATPERDPALWRTMLDEFGPKRKSAEAHPEIYPANAFIGNYLRLELLSRMGLGRMLLEETKDYFGYMAGRTGTLWENVKPSASCNHGFASYVALLYVRSILGIDRIDVASKTVVLQETDVPLAFCDATLPIPGGDVTYGWHTKDGERKETFIAPPGWHLARKPR